jgi:MFS family permease
MMSRFLSLPPLVGWIAVAFMVGAAIVLLTVVPPAQGNLFSDGGRRTRLAAGIVFAAATLVLFAAGSDATRWGFLLLGVAILAFAIPRHYRDEAAPAARREYVAPFVPVAVDAEEEKPVQTSVDPLQLAFPISFSVVAVDSIEKPVIADPSASVG